MAQDIPESKPVVQLPVATHSSIYSHNLTKKDYWINCQAGGLGFYTLLGRNPITLISVGSTSQKIMPAFQIDIGHDYECWLNMLLSTNHEVLSQPIMKIGGGWLRYCFSFLS